MIMKIILNMRIKIVFVKYILVAILKKVFGVSVVWIKKVIGVIIGYLKVFVKRVLKSIVLITLDKLFGLLLGAIFLASLKYAISGCLSVN